MLRDKCETDEDAKEYTMHIQNNQLKDVLNKRFKELENILQIVTCLYYRK